MGPDIEKVDRSSQATPLAQDVLRELQGQIDEGGFGRGAGPLQRQAGTAIEQFLNTVQTRATGGGGGVNFSPTTVNTAGQLADRLGQLTGALERGSERRTNRQAADLREAFGIAGSRFGTPLALGEARLRSDAASALDEIIANAQFQQTGLEQRAREFDVGSNIQQQLALQDFLFRNRGLNLQDRAQQDQTQLAAISQMFNQGQANLDPFLRLAQLGIIPEDVIASPGIGSQLLSGGLQVAGMAAGSPKGFLGTFGLGGNGGGGPYDFPPGQLLYDPLGMVG